MPRAVMRWDLGLRHPAALGAWRAREQPMQPLVSSSPAVGLAVFVTIMLCPCVTAKQHWLGTRILLSHCGGGVGALSVADALRPLAVSAQTVILSSAGRATALPVKCACQEKW